MNPKNNNENAAVQNSQQEKQPKRQPKPAGAQRPPRAPRKPAQQINSPATPVAKNSPAPRTQKPKAKPQSAPQQAKMPELKQQQNKNPNNRKPAHFSQRRPQAAANSSPLRISLLGGLGEVGKNMSLFECAGDMLIVDCGSLFPDNEMFGVDLVIPDFTFAEQNRDKIKGIVITHGHEDHIGALPYFLREMNLPVYATRLTLGLIKNKLEEHGLLNSAHLNLIVPGEKIKLGCFTVDPIHVNHSIPDAVAFAIDSPAGVVIHTGDFKIDFTPIGGGVTDLAKFAEYGKQGVLALMSDSTNSEKPGITSSERKVNEGLNNLFVRAEKKRILIATFASNLYRIQQIIILAVKRGRKVAISGRSMINNTKMALELGYLTAPEGTLIDIDQINNYPPEAVVLITTGSQGEPLSALSRMASNSHRQMHVGSEDFIIISATPIPGNEKMVTKVINGLMRSGAEVIYQNMYDVHVSGHACQEEQKIILNLTNPKYFIPVHGEYKHLVRHAQTAEDMGVPKSNIMLVDTGDTIVLTQNSIALGEPIQAGAVMVDGLGVGDVGSVVLRDRRLLSQDGIVVLAATVNFTTGQLESDLEIFSRGFVYVRESEQLLEETRLAVLKVIDEALSQHRSDLASLKTRIRETASGLLYRRTKRSPMILPVLMQVEA